MKSLATKENDVRNNIDSLNTFILNSAQRLRKLNPEITSADLEIFTKAQRVEAMPDGSEFAIGIDHMNKAANIGKAMVDDVLARSKSWK